MGLRRSALAAAAVLLAVGLYAASPFLSDRLVGTGEAYNYSLSVADAVTQMRAGIFPPLAGQTDLAFNGRIHPLRDAPYLHYLAYGVDLLTARRLTAWQLQNVSLVLSLVAAAFTCYRGLRWATGCGRAAATALAALYLLAPPLLDSAHALNLFMTVHAAVFVPLALAACVQGCRRPSFHHDLLLAAALAAIWLAHPPVALWMTATTGALRLLCFLSRPSRAECLNGAAAVAAGALLAGFVFASVGTLSQDLGITAADPSVWGPFPDLVVQNLRAAFPSCLLPLTHSAGQAGDLQLGYAGYALLAFAAAMIARRARTPARGLGILLFATAAGLLFLLLPVPGLTLWAWRRAPPLVLQMTTVWPGQRLYLVALAYLIFAAPLLAPAAGEFSRRARWLGAAAAAAALAWTVYEAHAFVGRGFLNRRPAGESANEYLPSNLTLTSTSYAYLETPPDYVDGVIDPTMEYRLLLGGLTETSTQLAAAAATGAIVATGEIRYAAKGEIAASPTLKLLPGHRYLLTVNFLVPPQPGDFYVVGRPLNRVYGLPDAVGPQGFGMSPGAARSITVWTDGAQAEPVQFKLFLSDPSKRPAGLAVPATFTLRDIDRSKLPVLVESGFPLRFRVDSPGNGYTVETPRRFITGYAATVNGQPGRVLRSPTGSAMVALPPGPCEVELDYAGPAAARYAWWAGGASWVLLIVAWGTGLTRRLDPARALARAGGWIRRHWLRCALLALLFAAGAVAAAAGLRRAHDLKAVGPVKVTFELPYGRSGRNQPLVVTGRPGRGVMVFVGLVDSTHVRLGADVWGQLFQTPPFEIDYSQPHVLVVSDQALLPATNPEVARMPKKEREYFGRSLLLELDGRQMLAQDCDTFEATPAEIYVGWAPFGSNTEPTFAGRILGVTRLPLPRRTVLPNDLLAQLVLRRAATSPAAPEPLVSLLKGANTRLLALRYQSGTSARLSLHDGAGKELLGQDVALAPGETHTVDLSYEPAAAPGQLDTLKVTWDGRSTLAQEDTSPKEQVPILITGLNRTADPGVNARFTGPELDFRRRPKPNLAPAHVSPATADLVLLFPPDRPGRREPLLTTGRTGAGDVLYVVYLDAQHVQVGFDHWNGPAATSGPIPVDYSVPHEVRITMASLVPAGRTEPDPGVKVALDDQVVIDSATRSYPAQASEITFGQNRIGASTADAEFGGTILYLSRGGAAAGVAEP